MNNQLNCLTTLLLTAATSHALDVSTLKMRNPIPTPNHLQAVRLLNGTWFTVGEYGALAARDPSGQWTSRESNHARSLSALAFGNGVFLALSTDSRTVLRSTDGNGWTLLSPSGLPFNNYGAIFANGRFWTAGSTDGVGSSADGITWTSLAVTNGSQIQGIAFGNGRYVAAGTISGDNGLDGFIAASNDGTNWGPVLHGVPGKSGLNDDFLMVRYLNNRFLAGGKEGLFLVSNDGLDWSNVIDVGVNDWFFDVTFWNGNYFLPGRQGKVHYSSNLTTWNQSNTGSNDDLYSVETDGNRLIVVGRNGFIASSTNGLHWQAEQKGSSAFFSGVTFGAGQFAAAESDGGIWTSPDAISWTRAFSNSNAGFAGIHSASSRLVGITYQASAIVSSNGILWNSHTIASGASVNRSRSLLDQVWAVGQDGFVAFSANGENWTSATAGGVPLNDVAFGAGLYVVVGEQGTVLSSPNGTQWTPRSIDATDRLVAVAYGAGRFVALSSSFGEAWWSADGITWTNSGFASLPFNAQQLFFEDGEFVAFAAYQGPSTSTDGLTWNPMNPFSSASPSSLLVHNGRVVLVGTFGLIMSNDEAAALAFTLLGGGQARLSWTGSGFTLKTSTDPGGGWGNAPNQSNPQTIQLNEQRRYFRLER